MTILEQNESEQAYSAGRHDAREEAQAEIERLQAKIDRLMLEYCPDEMTREQLDKWGECQKPVDKHKGE